MPDFQNLVISDLADANRTVNRWQVAVDLTDSETGAFIQHLTFIWPDDISGLAVAQKRALRAFVVEKAILMKAGLL